MFIISGFGMRGNDSPLSLWNFLHVFTATNISSLFTGSPFDKNRRHESKTKAHISHISKPEARHVLQLNSSKTILNVQVISGSSYLQSEIRIGFFLSYGLRSFVLLVALGSPFETKDRQYLITVQHIWRDAGMNSVFICSICSLGNEKTTTNQQKKTHDVRDRKQWKKNEHLNAIWQFPSQKQFTKSPSDRVH